MAEFENYSRLLDLMDKVRNHLWDLDSKFMDEFPQFIVVGPQSSGKSSLLYQLSGVKLPTSSTRCTVSPIVLCIRRKTNPFTSVKLIYEGRENQVIDKFDDITENITEAQRIGLGLAGRKSQYVNENCHIEVHVHGPQLPNMTLVDLPGFTSTGDNEKVEKMVQKYCQMKGTIILNVLKANCDIAGQMGAGFFNFNRNMTRTTQRVTVLTHCDCLTNIDAVTYIKNFKEYAGMNSLFAVVKINDQRNFHEEYDILNQISCLQGQDIELGCGKLSNHLEELMIEHVRHQFPLFKNQVDSYLKYHQDKLSEYDDFRPSKIMSETRRALNRSVIIGKIELANDLRLRLNQLRMKIEKLSAFPGYMTISSLSDLTKLVNITKEFHVINHEGSATTPQVITVCKGETREGKIILESITGTVFVNPIVQVPIEYIDKVLIDKVSEVVNNRGLGNLNHIDIQPVIETYASRFANQYSELLEQEVQYFYDELSKHFDNVLNEISNRSNCEFINAFRAKFFDTFTSMESLQAIDRLNGYNQTGCVWATDELKLEEIFTKLMANPSINDENSKQNRSAYLTIARRVQAYIEYQKTIIPEAASKDLTILLMLKSFQIFDDCLDELELDHSKYIRRDPAEEKQVQKLQMTVDSLTKALRLLQDFEFNCL